MKCKECKYYQQRIDEIYKSRNIYTNTWHNDIGDFRKHQDNWDSTEHIRTDKYNFGICLHDNMNNIGVFVLTGKGMDVMCEKCINIESSENMHGMEVSESFGCVNFEE